MNQTLVDGNPNTQDLSEALEGTAFLIRSYFSINPNSASLDSGISFIQPTYQFGILSIMELLDVNIVTCPAGTPTPLY